MGIAHHSHGKKRIHARRQGVRGCGLVDHEDGRRRRGVIQNVAVRYIHNDGLVCGRCVGNNGCTTWQCEGILLLQLLIHGLIIVLSTSEERK